MQCFLSIEVLSTHYRPLYSGGVSPSYSDIGPLPVAVPAPYQSGPTPEEHYYAQVLKGHIIQHGQQPRDL